MKANAARVTWAVVAISLGGVTTVLADQPVRAKGVATIEGGRIAQAKDAATLDALRRAVEQQVGVLIESRTIVSNMQLISDQILAAARGYVESFTELSARQRGDVYEVEIEAVVRKVPLYLKLIEIGVLKSQEEYPRMMVLVSEPEGGLTPAHRACCTQLTKRFVEKGFDLVDPDVIDKLLQDTATMARVNADDDFASLLALKHRAEVVLAVKMSVREAKEAHQLQQYNATLDFRALDPTTGKIMVADIKQVKGAGDDKEAAAVNTGIRGADALADYAIGEIIRIWIGEIIQPGSSRGEYTVRLLGSDMTMGEHILPFQRILEQVPDVTSAKLRANSDKVAEFGVRTRHKRIVRLLSAVFDRAVRLPAFEELDAQVRGNELVFLLGGRTSAPAKGKPTVAVLPIANKTGRPEHGRTADAITAVLEATLATAESLQLVERRRLDAVITEQDLSLIGEFPPKLAIRLGELLPAHILVVGELVTAGEGKIECQVRLVRTDNGKVLRVVSALGLVSDSAGLAKMVADRLRAAVTSGSVNQYFRDIGLKP